MERLIADANKVKEANGEMADLSIDSFADVVEAIHIMQEEMNISGTTAKEASTTISGSVNSMKAAWHNLLVGLSDDQQDFGQLVNNLIETIVGVEDESGQRVGGVINNIMPRVQQALEGIGTLMQTLLPELVSYVPDLLATVLPGLIDSATALVGTFLGALPDIINVVAESLPDLMSSLGDAIILGFQTMTDNLPTLADSLSGVLSSILTYISENADTLISSVADFLSTLITEGIGILAENSGQLAQALLAVVKAVVNAALEHPELLAAIAGMIALKNIGTKIVSEIGAGITAGKDKISSAVKTAIEGSSVAAGIGAGLGISAAAAGIGAAIAGLIMADADAKRANDDLSTAILNVLAANDQLSQSVSNSKGSYDSNIRSAQDNAAAAGILYGKLQDLIAGYDGSIEKKDMITAMIDELNGLIPGLGLTWDEYTGSLNLNNDEIASNIELMKAQAETAAAQQLYMDSIKESTIALHNFQDAESNLTDVLARAGITQDELNGYLQDGALSMFEMLDISIKSGTPIADLYALYEDLNDAVTGVNEAADTYIETQENAALAEATWEESILSAQDAMEGHKTAVEANSAAVDALKTHFEELGLTMSTEMESAIQSATDAGIQIPQTLVEGLLSGEIEEQNAVDRINELVKFEQAVENANLGGLEVSQSFIDSWLSGEYSLTDANRYLQELINFDTAISVAQESGVQVDASFVNGLLKQSGLDGVISAAETLGSSATPTIVPNEIQTVGASVPEILSDSMDDSSYLATNTAGAMADDIVNEFSGLPTDLYTTGDSSGSNLDTGFGSWNSTVSGTIDSMYQLFYSVFSTIMPPLMATWAYNIGSRFNANLALAGADITATASSIADSVYSEFSSLSWQLQSAGYFAGQGLYTGLSGWASALSDLAWSIANSINAAARAALKVKSPSRVMREIGAFTAEGLAIGIQDGTQEVMDAATVMSMDAVSAAHATLQGLNDMSARAALADTSGMEMVQAIQMAGADYTGATEEITDMSTESIQSYLQQVMGLLVKISNMQMVTDTGALVGEMAEKMDQAFEAIRVRENRG